MTPSKYEDAKLVPFWAGKRGDAVALRQGVEGTKSLRAGLVTGGFERTRSKSVGMSAS